MPPEEAPKTSVFWGFFLSRLVLIFIRGHTFYELFISAILSYIFRNFVEDSAYVFVASIKYPIIIDKQAIFTSFLQKIKGIVSLYFTKNKM